LSDAHAKALRDAALARARVWRTSNVAAFDFTGGLLDSSDLLAQSPVNCRFVPKTMTGTTPKFHCALADGEVVKVKYGRNAEIHAEAAASRLLTGLGFGADTIHIVPLVRCYGCPPLPFETGRVLDLAYAGGVLARLTPDARVSEYEWVSVEHRFEGRPIEVDGEAGWGWYELPHDAVPHGSTRTELDAFRLMAAFLVHWDNKAENQRLVCVTKGEPQVDASCPDPFAFIQDLGASFGPHKLNVKGWRGTPVWFDSATCRVSMRYLPFRGATFTDAQISEAGRQLLASQLRAMSDHQIASLFTAARVPEFEHGRWFGPTAALEEWVGAFRDKIRQIVEAGPCP
jgi:hypothetical protein